MEITRIFYVQQHHQHQHQHQHRNLGVKSSMGRVQVGSQETLPNKESYKTLRLL